MRVARLTVLNRNSSANFSKRVKTTVYRASNGLCNNPACRRHTVRTNREVPHRAEVAHISAASPKGPRFDKLMTDEERSAIRNCLLLCRECHREVDNNVYEYTRSILEDWRPIISTTLLTLQESSD